MNTLNICKKLIKIQSRTPETFYIYLAFPIVLIAILGMAFSGAFGEIEIHGEILIHDVKPGHIGEVLSDNFKHLENFKFDKSEDLEESKELVKNYDYDALVIINEESKNIEVIYNDNADLEKSVLDSFLGTVISRFDNISFSYTYGLDYRDNVDNNFIEVNSYGTTDSPNALDYYGVTIMTMIIMYGAFISAFGIIDERDKGTLNRMLSSPVKNHQVFLGVSAGSIVQILLQTFVVYFVCKQFLNVDYGSRPVLFFTILLSLITMVVCFGITLATLIKDTAVINTVIGLAAQVMVFIAGGYFILPETGAISFISKLSPIFWVNKGLFESRYSDTYNYVAPAIIIPLSTALIMVMLTLIKLNKRESK